MEHYVGMAGLRGCGPNCCDVYDAFESACESLIQMHDVGWEMLDELDLAIEAFEEACEELRQTGFAGIDLCIHGNGYMEVIECNCSTPWEHSEQPIQDTLEYLGYTEEEVREALKNEDNDRFVIEDLKDYLKMLEPKEPREEDFPTEADFDLALAQFDEKMYEWLGR